MFKLWLRTRYYQIYDTGSVKQIVSIAYNFQCVQNDKKFTSQSISNVHAHIIF